MELPKIEDFKTVHDDGISEKQGCDVCWFYQESRCCNRDSNLMKLLDQVEHSMHTECGTNQVHYELINK